MITVFRRIVSIVQSVHNGLVIKIASEMNVDEVAYAKEMHSVLSALSFVNPGPTGTKGIELQQGERLLRVIQSAIDQKKVVACENIDACEPTLGIVAVRDIDSLGMCWLWYDFESGWWGRTSHEEVSTALSSC